MGEDNGTGTPTSVAPKPSKKSALARASAEAANAAAWAATSAGHAAEQATDFAAKAKLAAEQAEKAAHDAGQDIDHGDYFEDDSDSGTRRIFAQEFVTQLRRLGAGTSQDLFERDGIAFFSAKPKDAGAIDHIGAWAERYGWAAKDKDTWSATDAGAAVPPPPSLAFDQVLTRILRVANPVRTNAADWLPLIALVAGAIAGAAAVRDFDTLDAVRALSVAVLVWSVAIQSYGEYCISRAFHNWLKGYPDVEVPDKKHPPKTKTITNSYYQRGRLVVAAVFDLAVIVSFGLLIYWQPIPFPAWDTGAVEIQPWLWTVLLMGFLLAGSGIALDRAWRRKRRDYVRAQQLDTATIGFWYHRTRTGTSNH